MPCPLLYVYLSASLSLRIDRATGLCVCVCVCVMGYVWGDYVTLHMVSVHEKELSGNVL